MFCSNCQNLLSQRKLSTTTVEHCVFCGGTFFEMNGINRILLSEARELASQKTTDSIAGGEKMCPKDRNVMAPLMGDSVPDHVTLLKCSICAGIFAYGDDLVAFKESQSAKLNYYMSWRKPMPNIAKVLVFSFALVFSTAVMYKYSPYSQPTAPLRADQDTCKLDIIPSETSTLMYCKTDHPYISDAVFINSQTGEEITRTINTTPNDVHMLSIPYTDIAPSSDICVKFVFNATLPFETACINLLE